MQKISTCIKMQLIIFFFYIFANFPYLCFNSVQIYILKEKNSLNRFSVFVVCPLSKFILVQFLSRCGWPEIVWKYCIHIFTKYLITLEAYIYFKKQTFKALKRHYWYYLLNHEKWYEIWLDSQNYRTRCICIMSSAHIHRYKHKDK